MKKKLNDLKQAADEALAHITMTEAQKQEESYSEALSQRIQRMYESNDTSYIELLLKSTSISDFFCRLESQFHCSRKFFFHII